MYQLWKVKNTIVNGVDRWDESQLCERNYVNDVKSWAEKHLLIDPSEWKQIEDSEWYYNLDTDPRSYCLIEWNN